MATSLDIANELISPRSAVLDLAKKESMSAQNASITAQVNKMQEPMAMQMLEYMPDIQQAVGYSIYRGSNTLLRGGFMDFKRFHLPGASGRYHYFNRAGQLTSPGSGRFYGGQLFGGRGLGRLGRKARASASAGKQGLAKSGRLNNLSHHYLGGRFHSLSIYGGNAHLYSPFGAAGFIGRNAVGRTLAKGLGLNLQADELAFGPGLFSNMMAGSRANALGVKSASRGSGILGGRARKIAKIDRSIKALGSINGLDAAFIENALKTGGAGVRGNLYASAAAGAGTQAILGYKAGVLGAGGQGGLTGRALTYAEKAEQKFATKFASLNLGTEAEGIAKLRSTFGKNFVREMGGIGQASKFGGILGQRAFFAALPVVNTIATVSLLYDLGRMAGTAIKGAVNLAKDAGKSLQGTIAKPLFGMGYKDTEAAATSRARGVMAIQNSQLNARSALGSEASMLAAHFG